jgi:hypothetical protein
MSTHTPGPWMVTSDGRKVYVDPNGLKPNGCYSVAQLFGPDGTANARLIAAAPELLAVCKRMLAASHEGEVALT